MHELEQRLAESEAARQRTEAQNMRNAQVTCRSEPSPEPLRAILCPLGWLRICSISAASFSRQDVLQSQTSPFDAV